MNFPPQPAKPGTVGTCGWDGVVGESGDGEAIFKRLHRNGPRSERSERRDKKENSVGLCPQPNGVRKKMGEDFSIMEWGQGHSGGLVIAHNGGCI